MKPKLRNNPDANRLRILLAVDIYQPESGGAAEWLRNYALWLANRGHQVCVLCERVEAFASEPFTVLALPAGQRTKNSWKRAGALQNLSKDFSADIVHDTGCLLASDVFHPLMGSNIHNCYRQLRAFPPALRLRRFWNTRSWRDVRLQLRQRRQCRLLVACSKKVAADFAQLNCKDSIVIPNGIRLPTPPTTEIIRQLRQELNVGDRLLVLATATNFYLKGVMTVLRAFSLLDGEIRRKFLVIFTGHNQDGTFQQFINRNNLRDCCRLAGWVKNINDYYHAADIFVHPTYHDAGSLSTLKALAAGCSVVTSQFDGSSDFISNGINGLILDKPGDAQKLAETLRRLLDSELRSQLSAAARQLAPSINQENQFQKLEALYSGLSSGKNDPA